MNDAPGMDLASAAALVEQLARVVGSANVLTDLADVAPALSDWRGFYHGRAIAVVRPGSTAEVAAVVRACAETGTVVVAQGGNTGMCGGATPTMDGRTIVLSLARMNRVLALDPLNDTITVKACCST